MLGIQVGEADPFLHDHQLSLLHHVAIALPHLTGVMQSVRTFDDLPKLMVQQGRLPGSANLYVSSVRSWRWIDLANPAAISCRRTEVLVQHHSTSPSAIGSSVPEQTLRDGELVGDRARLSEGCRDVVRRDIDGLYNIKAAVLCHRDAPPLR